MDWLFHWKDEKGITHATTDGEEADRALHECHGRTIWADRTR